MQPLHELAPPSRSRHWLEALSGKLARHRHLGWSELGRASWRFAAGTVVGRFRLRGVNHIGVGVRVEGHAPVVINPGGTIELGDDVVLSAPRTPVTFSLESGASLTIGSTCWINDGVWFGCTRSIAVGQRVLIGPGVYVFDNEYHDLYQRRRMPPGRPVTIADDVWLSTGAMVLAGVSIGRGAVVGAGAVVTRDVAAFSVVAGSPARLIGELDPSRFDAAASK